MPSGGLVETELVRGPMETDAQATWAPDRVGSSSSSAPPRGASRPGKAAPPSKKGPALLIAAFTAVLGVVLMWPPAKRPGLAANVTSTETETQETPGPLAAEPARTPSAKPTSKPGKPTATPKPLLAAVETPKPAPVPTAAVTPKPSPKPVVIPSPPVASATPQASPTPTPRPVAAVAVTNASPTPSFTPRPVTEEPPATSQDTYYSVHVFVTPADIDSKVYLVNSGTRYMDQGRGAVRLQPDKKGTYMLKVISAGYETFSKEIKVNGEHKLAVRLERIPPPPPVYEAPAAAAPYAPGPAPAPAPYYPPAPPPAPSGGPYQIQAPGI